MIHVCVYNSSLLDLRRKRTPGYKYSAGTLTDPVNNMDYLITVAHVVTMLTPWSTYNAHEHQNWTMDHGKKEIFSDEKLFSFTSNWTRWDAPWEAYRGGEMLWAMFCWESLGPDIHVDSFTCLNIKQTKWHPFIVTVFPNLSDLCHKKCSRMFNVWGTLHSPHSPDLGLMEKNLQDVLNKQVWSIEAYFWT